MLRVGFLIAGIALFIYLILKLGPETIVSLLKQIGLGVLLVCVVYGIYILLRAAALNRCLSRPERPSYRYSICVYVSGEAAKNLTLGGALFSEPFKAFLLKRSGLHPTKAFAATLTECLAHLSVSAGIAIIGLSYVLKHIAFDEPLDNAFKIMIFALAGFLLFSFFTGWFRLHWVGKLTNGIARLPWLSGRFRPNASKVYEVEDLLFSVVRKDPGRCLTVLAIELLAQCVLVFELFLILTLLELDFPAYYPVLIEAVAKFIRVAFFFVPLQVGAAEGVFTVLFESFGLLSAAGFTVSVVRRIRSLMISGLGLLAGWLLTK